MLEGIRETGAGHIAWRSETDSGQVAKSVCPHFLPCREGDKGFGCATMIFPVLFILGTNFVCQRKTCVPVPRAFRFVEAGKVRHQSAVRIYAFQWNYRA